jgi:hypothetical protein
MGFNMSMTVRIFALALAFFLIPSAAHAAPPEDLLAKLIQIAEPDQIEAFSNLNLTPQQESELRSLARGYAPQMQNAKSQPMRLMGLMNQALAEADKILTPAQRPLIRKLIPRPHQWEKLKRLHSNAQR